MSSTNDARSAASQRSDRARAFAAEHAEALTGAGRAEAEAAIAAADLRVKVVPASGYLTAEYRTDRIILIVDDQDLVTSVRTG